MRLTALNETNYKITELHSVTFMPIARTAAEAGGTQPRWRLSLSRHGAVLAPMCKCSLDEGEYFLPVPFFIYLTT